MRTSWSGHGDLRASLVLLVPLLLAYDLGVVLSPTASGADLVTGPLFALCGRQVAPYLLLHAGAALVFVAWCRRTGRSRTLSLDVVGPVVCEATIYALTLGVVIGLLVHDVLGLGARLGATGVVIVTSLGAGVHEELVFRLGLFLGGATLLRRQGLAPRLAWVLALVGSSLLFAVAHHVGTHGEPWHAGALVFRTLAGAAFACICWYRSLAHAVYAHVLYDLYVGILR